MVIRNSWLPNDHRYFSGTHRYYSSFHAQVHRHFMMFLNHYWTESFYVQFQRHRSTLSGLESGFARRQKSCRELSKKAIYTNQRSRDKSAFDFAFVFTVNYSVRHHTHSSRAWLAPSKYDKRLWRKSWVASAGYESPSVMAVSACV